MKKFFSNAVSSVKKAVSHCATSIKCAALTAVATVAGALNAAAQTLAGTGYDAGTSALEDVATEITKYVPYVVNLCYALAGVVAIIGAISVYIAMNNAWFLTELISTRYDNFKRYNAMKLTYN